MSLTQPRVKRLTFSLLSLTLLFNLTLPAAPAHAAPALEDTFALHSSSEGFYGTFTVGGVEYLYSVTQKRQMQESRIQRNNGQDIASCVLNKNNVTVIFAGVSITFNLSTQSISALETSEVSALRDFGAGGDAEITRGVITNIMTRSDQVLPKQLFGMVVMGMILGDDSNEARNLLPTAPPNGTQPTALSKLMQVELAHAFDSSPRKAELIRECKLKAARAKLKRRHGKSPKPVVAGCFGCCGAGCWGCTGIYTPECGAHDACVSQHGYWDPRCLALLAAAIYSYHEVICPTCL
ncbi:MAG: hypothetical protein JO360_12705 [Acidobacteria bacterium]|nr:hypothetical protein [Acidobacteriota bacterium]